MLKKIQVALYDRQGYMSCLVDYLCRKSHSVMETRLFTSLEMLKKAAESRGIDVLLAGEEVAGEIQGLREKIPKIMLLSEGSQVSEQSEYYLLFKYQSAQNIVKEILEQIAEDDRICYTQHSVLGRTADFIGVYAPFGGAGVTKYALSMAQGLAKHYKTLYVSMELFQGLELSPERKKGQGQVQFRGMSEVIFYLKQRKDKLALKLETLIVSVDGMDYIPAVEDYRDLYEMNCEDISLLLKVLLQQTGYEKTVFDIGYMGDAAIYLMEQCSQLYMPKSVTQSQKLKEQAFFRFLQREKHQKIAESFLRVEVN